MSESKRARKEIDPRIMEKITEELTRAIMDKAADGKISCAVLRKIAEDLEVPYRVAGAAADVRGVKVHGCELGCF